MTKGSSATKFAFDAESWNTCVPRTFNLNKVFRQKDQGSFVSFFSSVDLFSLTCLCVDFVDMLNEMRFGKISEKTESKFKHLSRSIIYNDGVEPTELCVVFSLVCVPIDTDFTRIGSLAEKMSTGRTRRG